MSTLSLREINLKKKQLTFGNISNLYHQVSNSVSTAEGHLKYTFDETIAHLNDKSNWNLQLLGGSVDALGQITCEKKPRISIYKIFTREAFEVHVIPWSDDREIDFDLSNRPGMDFKVWIPDRMKVVFRVSEMYNFIKYFREHGDDVDLELIKFAHNIAEDYVERLAGCFDTQKVHGISIRAFFEFAQKKQAAGEDLYIPVVYDFS